MSDNFWKCLTTSSWIVRQNVQSISSVLLVLYKHVSSCQKKPSKVKMTDENMKCPRITPASLVKMSNKVQKVFWDAWNNLADAVHRLLIFFKDLYNKIYLNCWLEKRIIKNLNRKQWKADSSTENTAKIIIDSYIDEPDDTTFCSNKKLPQDGSGTHDNHKEVKVAWELPEPGGLTVRNEQEEGRSRSPIWEEGRSLNLNLKRKRWSIFQVGLKIIGQKVKVITLENIIQKWCWQCLVHTLHCFYTCQCTYKPEQPMFRGRQIDRY